MRIPRSILSAVVLGFALAGAKGTLDGQEIPPGVNESGETPDSPDEPAPGEDSVPSEAEESTPAESAPVEAEWVPAGAAPDPAPGEEPSPSPPPERIEAEAAPTWPNEPEAPVVQEPELLPAAPEPELVPAVPEAASPVAPEPVTPADPEPVAPAAPQAPAAAGAQAAAEGTPALPASPEEPPAPGTTGQTGRKTGMAGGLKSVLNILTGDESGSSNTEQLDKGANEETQKKVNELVRLANTSIEKGRVSEAMRNVNELITLKPYDADFHFALGLCYRREGKYKEALKKYQDVLDLGGPKALVALLKAEANAAERDKEKAFEFLKEAAVGGRNIVNDVKTLPLLSEYQRDTEFIKLALQLEKFEVSAGKIHDPFTNPFPRPDAQEGTPGEEAPGIATLTPEEQEKLLHDAKKTYERVLFYIKLEDEGKAMKAYSGLREIMKKKDLLTIPKLVNEFRVLLARLEDIEVQIEGIRLKYYYNQAQVKLNQIREVFADGEYSKIEPMHSEIVKLTKEMEQTNARYKPVAEQILAVSTRWLTRSQIRQEFQNRKPTIQGIIISEDSKMALLNDRIIRQGEVVDDFRVVRVESNKVTFRYKGEEIPLVFRRY